jgi:hypothetical protein
LIPRAGDQRRMGCQESTDFCQVRADTRSGVKKGFLFQASRKRALLKGNRTAEIRITTPEATA